MYITIIDDFGFVNTRVFTPPVPLAEGLERTIKYEFIDKIADQVFYTE
jgi:hypothetical protein